MREVASGNGRRRSMCSERREEGLSKRQSKDDCVRDRLGVLDREGE